MSRRYSEEEVRALLNGAIQRQEAAKQANHATGLTLEEVQHIASEVGVDPAFVSAATSDLTAPPKPEAPEGTTFWGAPLRYEIKRVLPGTFSETMIADMVSEIRGQTGHALGTMEILGDRFEWLPNASNMSSRYIRVQERDGQLHLSMHEKYVNHAVLYHMFDFMPAIIGSIILLASGNVSVFFSLMALSLALFTAAFFATRTHVRANNRKLENLADRLEETARRHHANAVPASTATAAPPTATPVQIQAPPPQLPAPAPRRPQLDLDQILDEAPADETSRAGRKRLDTYHGLD